ncbi:MAG: hypothetical protein JXR19_11195 [Bacteroidia bacterium]
MKRLTSIFFIAVLSYAGLSNLFHLAFEEQDHCSQNQEHFCSIEGHHHCSLCDVTFAGEFEHPDNLFSITDCQWSIIKTRHVKSEYAFKQLAELSRGPPLKEV